jgi:hypothetical protein
VSRAAVLFVGATVGAACGGQTQASPPSDGGRDAVTSEGAVDGDDSYGDAQPLPAYGPAPIEDSGPAEASPDGATDAPSDADSGGLPVLYAPAPVDGGSGQDD